MAGGYLKIIFVSTNSVWGRIIKRITGGKWSHCGILYRDGIVEAEPSGVELSFRDKYRRNKTEVIDFYVPNTFKAYAKLRDMRYRPYGWLDCLNGYLMMMWGRKIPWRNRSINCTELIVRTIRAGGGVIDPATPADCFTPQGLYWAMKNTMRITSC